MASVKSGFGLLARDRRGAAAVEFAIIAPVMLASVFGVFEVGRLMYDQSKVAAAAAAGARAVALYGGADTTNVTNAINARFTTAQRQKLTTTLTTVTMGGQNFRRIIVTYNFSFLIKFGHRFNGMTITATRYAPAF
jgi:Flp pilus assembly protein TadG